MWDDGRQLSYWSRAVLSLGYLLIDGVRVILCKRKHLGLCDDVLNSADVNVSGLMLF